MNLQSVLKPKRSRYLIGACGLILLAGLLLPQELIIPVKGAEAKDWNPKSWWYEPWGISGVHKGIDIFAPKKTPVLAPTYGLVIYSGEIELGGNAVFILGPKWRVHFFGHLNKSDVFTGQLVARGQQLGEVGDSGNAQGKPPHLHYQIDTWIPYPWRCDTSTQGWKKMFILDPSDYLPKKQQLTHEPVVRPFLRIIAWVLYIELSCSKGNGGKPAAMQVVGQHALQQEVLRISRC